MSVQAERLALEFHGENSKFTCISTLKQQMQRLESILPCMDVRALIVKDSLVVNVDASAAARRLVFLSSRLGHPDLVQLIKTAPQLLYAEVRQTIMHLCCICRYVDACVHVLRCSGTCHVVRCFGRPRYNLHNRHL